MTANQLADKLIGSLTMEYDCDKYMKQAATMLRQQAQEIAMLKQIIDANNLQSDIGQLKKELALQKLSDIGQEIENEPVAWMSNGKEFYVQKNYCPGFMPLYTHPMRELIDEEIEQVGKETMLLQFFQSIEATADHGDSVARAMTAMIRQQAFDFARAILKKAGER